MIWLVKCYRFDGSQYWVSARHVLVAVIPLWPFVPSLLQANHVDDEHDDENRASYKLNPGVVLQRQYCLIWILGRPFHCFFFKLNTIQREKKLLKMHEKLMEYEKGQNKSVRKKKITPSARLGIIFNEIRFLIWIIASSIPYSTQLDIRIFWFSSVLKEKKEIYIILYGYEWPLASGNEGKNIACPITFEHWIIWVNLFRCEWTSTWTTSFFFSPSSKQKKTVIWSKKSYNSSFMTISDWLGKWNISSEISCGVEMFRSSNNLNKMETILLSMPIRTELATVVYIVRNYTTYTDKYNLMVLPSSAIKSFKAQITRARNIMNKTHIIHPILILSCCYGLFLQYSRCKIRFIR